MSSTLLLGVAVEVRGGAPYNFINTPLDCKKSPREKNVRVHLILERKGYLLYDITNKDKSGGAVAPHATWLRRACC